LSPSAGIGSRSGATLKSTGGAITNRDRSPSRAASAPPVTLNLNMPLASAATRSTTSQPSRGGSVSASPGQGPNYKGIYYAKPITANQLAIQSRDKALDQAAGSQTTSIVALVAVAGVLIWHFFF